MALMLGETRVVRALIVWEQVFDWGFTAPTSCRRGHLVHHRVATQFDLASLSTQYQADLFNQHAAYHVRDLVPLAARQHTEALSQLFAGTGKSAHSIHDENASWDE
ncbi:hypothetical protein LJ656_23735 [Paraburkholderia sp. MMS20-SJTR3]|uniref:Uncharacterized protein n=1 Tax=Paraburkholderia sejongensis TaxID=2886946 RepID=A0ABS8K0C4_9BURK|nr:hypothetical protein [Paraburkholderia sp. MMS20-SJTR3]MCC8395596.1 hypothetical protein [Paraburkholderia sp. MMS20-SJTR3]